MRNIIAVEYAKLKKFHLLKILFGAYMIVVPSWMFFMDWFFNNNPELKPLFTDKNLFDFPYIWGFTTYCASFFNILLCVVIVIITCNEIQHRTMRQNIIDGMSKQKVILGKFVVVVFMSLLATVFTFIAGLLFGGINGGVSGMFNGIHLVVLYFLQTLGYFCFAFLFALIVKRPAIAIVSFILYFPVETIIGQLITFKLKIFYQFFPLKVFADLTPRPFLQSVISSDKDSKGHEIWAMETQNIILFACFYIVLFFLLTYWILKRRDL